MAILFVTFHSFDHGISSKNNSPAFSPNVSHFALEVPRLKYITAVTTLYSVIVGIVLKGANKIDLRRVFKPFNVRNFRAY